VTGHAATLIHDPRERAVRRQAKQERVLRWLRGNTWSSADILREVARLGSRQAAHAMLKALAREGFIRAAVIAGEYGPTLQVWGITAHGAAMSAAPGEPIETRLFEPSKVNPATLAHTLDVQRLQLHADHAGWRWRPIAGEFARSEAKYADAIAIRPDGKTVAIEVERTVKTAKRYAEILVAHLAARKQGKWEWVYYLSPQEAVRDRVQRVFGEIRRATWRGQAIEITDAHRAPFKFFTYDEDWT